MISHKHKCIFVHIPKNAGQSIEHVFLDQFNLTWETRAPLLLSSNNNPRLGPPRLAHLHAADYVKFHYISEDLFGDYFKFSFVRNPWDRIVSIYKYSQYSLFIDFKTFLKNIFLNRIWANQYWFVGPQSDFICDSSGKSMMDFVGRFESLQSDFDKVCHQINLGNIVLPHINKSSHDLKSMNVNVKRLLKHFIWKYYSKWKFPRHKNFQEYYDSETKEIVFELYRKDIDIFEYTFNAALD